MPSKYDTNPLDPDFPAKAQAAADAEVETSVLGGVGAPTRQFAESPASEEATRRFATQNVSGYQQPFTGQYVPANFVGSSISTEYDASKRKVEKIGLPENIVIALPYLPFYVGLVAGIVLLAILPKSESKIRFHAAQGLAAHIGVLIVTTILGMVGNVTDVADIGNKIFQAITSIMMIIFAVKAWKGKPVHIESIESLTNWLEEKIDPKIMGK